MQAVQPDQLRNIVITGHAASGKTLLAESLALSMGVINRLGSIDDGNTLSDYSLDEIQRKHSLNTSLIHGFWNDCKLNIIDTPWLRCRTISASMSRSWVMYIPESHIRRYRWNNLE